MKERVRARDIPKSLNFLDTQHIKWLIYDDAEKFFSRKELNTGGKTW